MATVRQDNTTIWDSNSLDTFGGTHKKVTPCECRSQPVPKPNFNSSQDGEFNEKNKQRKVILLFKKFLKSCRLSEKEPESLDESKRIIRDLAKQLDRILQLRHHASLSRVIEDSCTELNCEDFILQWAEKLRNLPKNEQFKQAEQEDTMAVTSVEKSLRSESKLILFKFAWNQTFSTKELEEEEVERLQELVELWRRGDLPAMSPVLEVILMRLRQELPQKVPVVHRPVNKSRGHSQAAMEPMDPAQAERLKEAQRVLSRWACSLKILPQSSVCSVCVGEEVSEVMKELERQWKRGLLPNLLPVLEFTMWSLIQPQAQEGSIPQLWLKSKQRFRHTAAMRHIPQSVWKWIREASADIKLDPETSHPDLRLSADRKRVKMDTIIESKCDPRDGHRRSRHKYDGWWCVQGSEGFTEGRHYWEVGVQGKVEWRIGVVKESADRRGFIDLNTQSGYWTLRLQGAPSRLGVHLDMEEGQLSFNDVERSCHIYTFNDDFDEKVYPLFGTVETDREIVILQ
ncbi:hypothetical protein AGOR_G00220270 [Albula goreensis]|uniref:B30.2/SPRY domain-containing protein n=1 Tax=Albula goreensis TaxID=1534307 RepID=A0A8T3CQ84_9TELE|nr:hypothetical protein AGOR_G00220270 [Albula goreensis]